MNVCNFPNFKPWLFAQLFAFSALHFDASCRLIKGDGEVLEEIVSMERHKAINKVACLMKGVKMFWKVLNMEFY